MTFPARPIALLGLLFSSLAPLSAAEPFSLQDGDRVLLLGDTLIERENSYGHIEARMRAQFPTAKFSVRNLGFSADTPLGWSRASFDPASHGVERLTEQLALVKPTVAILGYGMAASLEELTYRKNDPSLNPDPARYGTEHSPIKFKADLAKLMDLVAASSPGTTVRFILLGPIAHEDLRSVRPGLPDPAEHNQLLSQYTKVIQELAKERGARFIEGEWKKAAQVQLSHATENGIHLSSVGYQALSDGIAAQLGWAPRKAAWKTETAAQAAIRSAIRKKNELFFHRWRPANHTYLLGFRKGEQGRNASEIPKFDPLIEKAEAEIHEFVSGKKPVPASAAIAASKLKALAPQPAPDFTLGEGLEITLFAENPLLEKPVQMNWDARGRLWVASSNTYPQVNPEDLAAAMAGDVGKMGVSTGNDKILVLEDRDHDGKAESSQIFADGLLIPTAVAPDNAGGCYVGASTELLHLGKPGADGRATERRVVLSGFGTEDTHHMIHTLHWGNDARLYFHQSVYIHSHLETPWGVVRANAGAVFAYDPKTERVEVFCRGLWNSWGQQEDSVGQTFLTDGAGGDGINWAFPGSVFTGNEGSRRILKSISPGAYPKFCGLEIIRSPHFPEDWQGNAITCDFRAHRIVRMGINDLSKGEKPRAGYVTKDMPDLVRTGDVSFRPVDVRLGPDGALYVADWSNPVINHGEVDFRDPRRDKHHGRIWRISAKAGAPVKWESITGKSTPDLLEKLLSKNRWEMEQARHLLAGRKTADLVTEIGRWLKTPGKDEAAMREAAWILSGKASALALPETLVRSANPDSAVIGIRELVRIQLRANPAIVGLLNNPNPRVRLEAMRAVARNGDAASADLILANVPTDKSDLFLDFAAWQSINDLAKPWADAVLRGQWKVEGREAALEYALNAIDPVLTTPVINLLVKDRPLTRDGAGPWIELIGKGGNSAALRTLFAAIIGDQLDPKPRQRALDALVSAVQVRNARPDGELAALLPLFDRKENEIRAAAARLAGLWKLDGAGPRLETLALGEDANVRNAAFEGLRSLGGTPAQDVLTGLVAADKPLPVRRLALVALANVKLSAALTHLPDVFSAITSDAEALETWRGLLKIDGAASALEKEMPKKLPPITYAAGLKAARETGKKGAALAKVFEPLAASLPVSSNDIAGLISGMVAAVKGGGDPAEGELIYRRIGCVVCHAIGGAGGKMGPDLSSLGASAPLDYSIESVFNPAAKVKEGYHAFAFTMKDGSQLTGIPTRETATEQFIRPGPGPEMALVKANIVKRENVGSLMPPALADGLDHVAKRSLFAFMGELGKPGGFDASKGNVARVWWLYADNASALKSQPLDQALPVQTLVDGRLISDLLKPLAESVGKGELFAVARFEAPSPTQKPLIITGATTAWLDGDPLVLDANGSYAKPIPAGAHTLAVKLDPKQLPASLKLQCDDVRFIGE